MLKNHIERDNIATVKPVVTLTTKTTKDIEYSIHFKKLNVKFKNLSGNKRKENVVWSMISRIFLLMFPKRI